MVTTIFEAKVLVKLISWDCKCRFNSKTCNSYRKWNNGKYQCEFKKYCGRKKDYNTSVIVSDEITFATNSVSTYKTNTIPVNMTNSMSINATSTASINCADKKVRYKMDCYILHTFLLVITLLLVIAINCYTFV